MALLAAFRRGVASCSRSILPFQRRSQNAAAAFDMFAGEELHSDPSNEELALAGSQALRTDTFVKEVALSQYQKL